MNEVQQLIDRRAAAYAEAKEVLARATAERRDLTRGEIQTHEGLLVRIDDLTDQIESRDKMAKLEQRFDGVESAGGDYSRGVDDDSREMRAFVEYMRNGDVTELRALGVTTGAGGGFTAPESFWARVGQSLKAYGGIRRRAEVITTDTGNPLSWPTNDDTSNVGEIVAENAAHSEDTAMVFGAKTLNAYQYSSKIIRVSRQMLQDTSIPFESWLANRIGQRIGRKQADNWINGTGASQPQGILSGLSTGKTTAAATIITYGELVDLLHSVDIAYREGVEMEPGSGAPAEDCVWLMNDLVLAYLRKIVDSTGNPIIQENARVGAPFQILGHSVVIDNAMPSAVTTGQKTVAFGNIKAAYVIRDVKDSMELLRMTERYGEYNQVAFLGASRADGLVQDVSAAKLLVQA